MKIFKSLFGSGRFLVALATIICTLAIEAFGIELSTETVVVILGTVGTLITGLSIRQQDKTDPPGRR